MTINYSKSIEKMRVVANPDQQSEKFALTAFYVFHIFGIGVFILWPVYFLIKLVSGGTAIGWSLMALAPMILGAYLITCLFNFQRLVKITGIDLETNKRIILPIVDGYYPQLSYAWDGNILLGGGVAGFFKSTNGVVIIFDSSDIYLNIQSFSYDGPNAWMASTNIKRANEIAELFREQIRYGLKNEFD
jgi:hypothetical protein